MENTMAELQKNILQGWEVDRTDSGTCPKAGFCTYTVELPGSATIQ